MSRIQELVVLLRTGSKTIGPQVTIGIGTAEAEPVSTIGVQVEMQDMEETGPGIVKAGGKTVEITRAS